VADKPQQACASRISRRPLRRIAMALPHSRLLPALPACQPQAPPRLSFSTVRASLRLGQASFVVPSTGCSWGNRSVACAASATVAVAPALEVEAGKPVEPKTRLIAQNIPWDCTADDMRALFEKHGAVVDVEVAVCFRRSYLSEKKKGMDAITSFFFSILKLLEHRSGSISSEP
jgi:hypothetical protein